MYIVVSLSCTEVLFWLSHGAYALNAMPLIPVMNYILTRTLGTPFVTSLRGDIW